MHPILTSYRPCRDVVKDPVSKNTIAKARWEELHALQAQKHWRATHRSWWLAWSYAYRSGAGRCRVCKDRWRTPKGDIVARGFGNNNATGILCRKRSKSEHGDFNDPAPTETVVCG